jgi:hypothetical protein
MPARRRREPGDRLRLPQWGVKARPDSEIEVEAADGDLTYRFPTLGWSPDQLVMALSEQWPTLRFAHAFDLEYMGRGGFVYGGGEIVDALEWDEFK